MALVYSLHCSLCLVTLVKQVNAGVELTWIEDGSCTEYVLLRCVVTAAGALRWTLLDEIVGYNRGDTPGSIKEFTIPEVLNVTLISLELISPSQLGNFISIIIINITSSISGRNITCSNGASTDKSLTLGERGALPLMPVLVAFDVVYNPFMYSVTLKWKNIDHATNYTIILKNDYEVLDYFEISFPYITFKNLNYSTNYTAELFGTNCIGNSPVFSHTFSGYISEHITHQDGLEFVNCSLSELSDSLIEEEEVVVEGVCVRMSGGVVCYSGEGVGSVAVLFCDDGYSLEGHSTRECLSTGLWNGSSPQCVQTNRDDREKSILPSVEANTTDMITLGVTCSVAFLIVGIILGVLGLLLTRKLLFYFISSKSAISQPANANYEEVGLSREVKSSQVIQLTPNEAYGPLNKVEESTM